MRQLQTLFYSLNFNYPREALQFGTLVSSNSFTRNWWTDSLGGGAYLQQIDHGGHAFEKCILSQSLPFYYPSHFPLLFLLSLVGETKRDVIQVYEVLSRAQNLSSRGLIEQRVVLRFGCRLSFPDSHRDAIAIRRCWKVGSLRINQVDQGSTPMTEAMSLKCGQFS